MNKIKISNSALDAYQRCPRYYKFRYVEQVKGDHTSTPLLFGSAIDNALNYILESIRDKKEWTEDEASKVFLIKMSEWSGQNRLEFFKNEIPEGLNLDQDMDIIEKEVWINLVNRGYRLINTYIKEVLPLIEEVISVQNRGSVLNEDGDEFVFVLDFIAKLKDGRTVLFDNKTASAKYKKKAVVDSQQLSFYIEQFPKINLAGYIVLIKDPSREKGMTHQIIIDDIPEETRAKSFQLLDETLQKIKNQEFPCNYKSCKAFGKICEYSLACMYNDYTGLVPNKKKDD